MNNFFTTSLSKWTPKLIPPKLFRCLRYLCGIFMWSTTLMQAQNTPLVDQAIVIFNECTQHFEITYDLDHIEDGDFISGDFHYNGGIHNIFYHVKGEHWPLGTVGSGSDVTVCGIKTMFRSDYGSTLLCGNHNDKKVEVHFPLPSGAPHPSKTITLKYRPVNDITGFAQITGITAKDFLVNTIHSPEKVKNPSTEAKGCNEIKISWELVCNSNIQIYRSGTNPAITLVDGNTTSYTDTGIPSPGTYTYTLRTISKTNGTSIDTYIDGNTYSLPSEAPSNFTATDDNCGESVDLNWNWNFSDHTGFTIERSTNSNFSPIDKTFQIDAKDIRSLEDSTAIINTVYYYRILTKNDCGNSIHSSTIQGGVPDIPVVATNVTAVQDGNSVRVDWKDNSLENKFYIRRILQGGGFDDFDGAKNDTQYIDNQLSNCQTYYYKIKAENDCGTTISTQSLGVKLIPDLSQIVTDGSLKASKGYRPGEVRLEWTVTDGDRLEFFKIYRKVYGSNQDSVLIATVPANTHQYSDYDAAANTLFEYTLQGQSSCEGTIIKTGIDKEVGFRSPSGIVGGNINYEGGIAVKDVKVVASTVSGASGNSLLFDGQGQYAQIPHDDLHKPTDGMTVGLWVHPLSLDGSTTLLHKSNGGTSNNGFGIHYIEDDNQVEFWTYIDGTMYILRSVGALSINEYTHIGGSYDGGWLKLFVNGLPKDSTYITGALSTSNAPMYLGGNSSTTGDFHGNLDELVLLDYGRNNLQMEQDYARILSNSEEGLIGYWRFDEGTGPFLFDATEISPNNFNEAHGARETAQWSATIPTASQLGMVGYTDENGSYIIENVRYEGNGENFTIVPIKGIHQFDPNQRILFIGDGSTVHNNTDFTDVSSFKVTGSVRYKDTNCFAKEVFIKIDGETIVKDGLPVQTDANGLFEVQVPIGEHFLSVEKTLHNFEVGRWPATGKHNFQDAESGIEFIDSTLITVVGRVVGGKTEGDKKPGFGKSVNNIGEATITFKSQQGNGCATKIIKTDAQTGEYTVQLPPLKYIVDELSIASNPLIDFGTLDLVDLYNALPLQTEVDTVFVEGAEPPQVEKINTVKYHLRNDYVYRNTPQIEVSNEEDSEPFSGEKEVFYEAINGDTFPLDLVAHPFPHPVFVQGSDYTMLIKAFEKYTNFDDNGEIIYKDSLKDGTFTITNKLATKETPEDFPVEDGKSLYTFKAGYPNSLINNAISEYSYAKTLEILLRVGEKQVTWTPVAVPPPGGDQIFRGYVFGSKPTGNSFVTEGPQVVDMIIRDPPGSYSSAYFQKDESTSSSISWSLGGGTSVGLSTKIKLGTKFQTGFGFIVETKASNTLLSDTKFETKINEAGEFIETWTSSKNIATRDAPELVGAPSDLFIGKSRNIIFGPSEKFSIVPSTKCNESEIECTDIISDGYAIAKTNSMWIVPTDYETQFIYDQNHIANYLIPDLINVRNSYIARSSVHYTDVAAKNPDGTDNEKYGTNNDDPIWGDDVTSTDEGKFTNEADFKGKSYEYTGDNPNEDSIRYYNQQIRLWKEALKRNEEDKVTVTDFENISFSGGATIEKSKGYSFDFSHQLDFEYNISHEIGLELGLTSAGVGFEATGKLGVTVEASAGKGNDTGSTTTFGYTFSDDAGDFFSVNVAESKMRYGPIFKTVAGETACPHEGERKTQYYEPDKNHILSERTLQAEVPVLDISPSILVNVPADEAATFNLSLGNDTEVGVQKVYRLQVLEESNPFGAILQVDGASPNREFAIPANSSINKVLTVKRGPSVYEYDNLKLILHSTCQFQAGTGDDVEIVDTVSLSVHYLPVCTDIEILEPEDQWVVNNSFNDTLPVIIGGYDINYPDLEKIRFQYRPVSSPNWIGLETYFKGTDSDPPVDTLYIPQNQPYIRYDWDMSQLPDANYYMRAVSECSLADEFSNNYVGIADRINPHPFGTPSPGDGILSPNDDISIQFNEPIETGSLTIQNFDIRGVLNGAELRHGTSVYFNGTDSKMTIPEGIHLASGSFSIESWVRRSGANEEECIFSQGVNTGQSIFAGFNANDQLTLRIAGESVQTTDSFTDTNWHHIVFSYDAQLNVIEIFVDSDKKVTQTVYPSYEGTGRIGIGYSLAGAPRHFDGNLHELRLWGKSRTESDIAARRFVLLTGREAGILGVWQMDEAVGTQAAELLRERHATLENTTWTVEPLGRAYSFNGSSDYLSTPGISYNDETDMTIEFWFNSTNGNNVSFFSNGKGDGSDNATSWNIGTDANGKIIVTNQDKSFEAVSNNYFDGQWHHFALVVNRLSDMAAYIDGNLQNTTDSDGWGGFGGAKIFVGCRGWSDFNQTYQDRHFAGSMDEVRLWKTSRKQEQIVRDRTYKQAGDEFGLDAYWAFEDYEEQAGVNVLVESLKDLAVDANDVTTANDLVANGGTYSDQTPPIRLPRPVQKVNYTYSVNNDKIIITPTDPPALIENVTLDITVRNIQDLQGNKMQSPVTWIAYVDKNQTVWEEQQLYFEKTLGEPLSFSTRVLNQGGDLKNFTIDNLPTWLTANPRVSSVAPNSYLDITFTVDESLNIGEYTQDLQLNTDFGFSEILVLELKVSQTPPEWEVNPSDFAFSMNVVGQVKVEDIFSTDDEDILYAVVNNEIRAKAQLQYAEAYDKYLVFMDIYSNQVSGETVEFRFWDASQGRVYVNITPQLDFASDTNIGTPSVPQIFEAPKDVYQTIPISSGWNWISFNLTSNDSSDVNKMLKTLQPIEGNVIKGLRHFDQYFSNNEWFGSLSANGGIKTDELYKVQINGDADLVYTGAITNPSTKTIEVVSGWNWIGYIGLRNLTVNAALTSFNATDGDLIKGQFAFAIYDSNLGWVGSLTHLEPNQGYMLYANNADTFTFPVSGIGSGKTADSTPSTLAVSQHWEINRFAYPSNMTVIGQVEWCDLPEITDDLRIGAFDGEECRGIGKLWYDEDTGQYQTYLTVYGDGESKDLTLRLVHEETGIELEMEESLSYKQDDMLLNGFFKASNELACNKLLDELPQDGYFSQVTPIPFDSELEIEFTLEESGNVEVLVFDMAGKPIATLLKEQKKRGNWTLNWDAADYPLGMYVVLIRTPHFTHTHKALKAH